MPIARIFENKEQLRSQIHFMFEHLSMKGPMRQKIDKILPNLAAWVLS